MDDGEHSKGQNNPKDAPTTRAEERCCCVLEPCSTHCSMALFMLSAEEGFLSFLVRGYFFSVILLCAYYARA